MFKTIFLTIILITILSFVNSAIVINGCVRSMIEPSGKVVCIECTYFMGVTGDGKCGYCSPGQSIVNYKCLVARPQIEVVVSNTVQNSNSMDNQIN